MQSLVIKVFNTVLTLLTLLTLLMDAFLLVLLSQIEASVVMVLVISPAGFRLNLVISLSECFSVFHLTLKLEFLMKIVSIFLFKSTLEILLEHSLSHDGTFMGLKVRQSLVKFIHESLIVGSTEVSVVVSTKLIVSVDHMTDGGHHPFD